MTAIIQQDVTAFAPELLLAPGAVAAGAWIDILALVNEIDLTAISGTSQETRMARIFLAAHMGAMTKRAGGGTAGPVTGESAGGVRRSYGLLASMTGSSLSSTRYGQLYLDLLAMSPANGPFVI